MTEPRAVPVAEPVFLRGTRTLWLFSRKNFFDPGHSFAKKQLCPCLSSQKNFPDVTRQDFPGKKYLFIWALIAHLLHPPPSYTQCGQIFHFLKSFKQKKCRNKKCQNQVGLSNAQEKGCFFIEDSCQMYHICQQRSFSTKVIFTYYKRLESLLCATSTASEP